MGVPGGGQTEGLAQAAQAEWMRAARSIGWYGRARQRASDLSVAGGPGRCAAAWQHHAVHLEGPGQASPCAPAAPRAALSLRLSQAAAGPAIASESESEAAGVTPAPDSGESEVGKPAKKSG